MPLSTAGQFKVQQFAHRLSGLPGQLFRQGKARRRRGENNHLSEVIKNRAGAGALRRRR